MPIKTISLLFFIFFCSAVFAEDLIVKKKLKMLTEKCEQQDGEACFTMAALYDNGTKAPKNDALAANYYQRACDLNYFLACSNLAVLYTWGWGVKKDYAKMQELFEKSCKGGCCTGCWNLSQWYVSGGNDKEKAALYLKETCDLSDDATRGCTVTSCYNAGLNYLNGQGVTPDATEAARYFRKACDAQVRAACDALGSMYAEGKVKGGKPVDAYAEAARLFRKACKKGTDPGCQHLNKLCQSRKYPECGEKE